MNLYATLDLVREPFSNSPDPNFLLETRQHATCLQELEISLRLRRGLSVITGDIGTGKTTLCRSLLRAFRDDAEVDMHLLLDPHFSTSEEFLRVILGSVSRVTPDPDMGMWELREALKQQLFRLGMVERRLVVLIIDEGQKISPENLELLREMLNYETNSSKLLQIVIFAQREFEPLLETMPNLVDRINVRRRLRSLSLVETRQMIRYRLRVAANTASAPQVRFSFAAILRIHLASGGSPRKIVRLCHMAMLEMLVRGKMCVGLGEARAAIRPDYSPRLRRRRALVVAAAVALCLCLGSLWLSEPTGPVLGHGLGAARAQSALRAESMSGAMPDARSGADPEARSESRPGSRFDGMADAKTDARADAKTDAKADAQADTKMDTRFATLAADGLTLLPRGEEAQDGLSGLTLLPQRDQGPVVRSPIVRDLAPAALVAPARLHVAGPEDEAGQTGATGSSGLFRTVAFRTVGQK